MDENERLLLAFAVSQSINQLDKNIKEEEISINSPFADRALAKLGITKEEAFQETKDRRSLLEEMRKVFEEYLTKNKMKD